MDEQRILKQYSSTRRAIFGLGLLTVCFGLLLLFLSLTLIGDRSAWLLSISFAGGFLFSGFGLLFWKSWARHALLGLHVLHGLGCLATPFPAGFVLSLIFVVVLINSKVGILMDHEGSVESAVLSQRTEEALDLFD